MSCGLRYGEETVDYDYDLRSQLTGADYDYNNTVSGAEVADESYAYDANGNRQFTGGEIKENNRLTNDGRFEYKYDNEGNRTRRTELVSESPTGPVTDYEWDHRNRLTKVTERPSQSGSPAKVVEYGYDILNQQVIRKVHQDGNAPDESTFLVYDRGQIVLELDGSLASDLSHRYLWGPVVDQVLADEQLDGAGPGDVAWALGDQLGSVRDVVQLDNGTARVVKHRAYDAFGNLRGDLNYDGNVDLEDINLLLWAINNGVADERFDLNGDGQVDNVTDGDLDQMILYILSTYYGDANLDGEFNSSDLAYVFGFGEYNDGNNDNSTWEESDWDGDGDFDTSDYVLALTYGTYENGPNPNFSDPGVEFVFGYTGRYYDGETQLQNNLNRWYDPKVGRWLSQDPIGFAAGDANLYRYVGNEVTGFVDPDGLIKLFGQHFVAPWSPNASYSITGNLRNYGRATRVAAVGTASGAASGAVVGAGTGAAVGSLGAGVGAAPGAAAGGAMGAVGGGINGLVGAAFCDTAIDAAKSGAISGAGAGLGGAGAALNVGAKASVVLISQATGEAFEAGAHQVMAGGNGRQVAQAAIRGAAMGIVPGPGSEALAAASLARRLGVKNMAPRVPGVYNACAPNSVGKLSQPLRNKMKRIGNQIAAGGNRGISGAVSSTDALKLGERFVGPGYRVMSGNKGLISADGLRQFRFPAAKRGISPVTGQPWSDTGIQVNFQSRLVAAGAWLNNVHLDILK